MIIGKDAESESIRASQGSEMLAALQNMVDGSSVPMIIAADLNAEPNKADKIGDPLAYNVFLDHSVGLRSAYQAPMYTTWKRRPKGEVKRVIDYIFFSPSLLSLQSHLALLTEDEMPPG